MPDDPDRDIRLNEAWHAADELARRQLRETEPGREPTDKDLAFVRDLYLYDTSPDTSEHELLRHDGVELPPADDLADAALSAKLWEVIHALGARNVFLHCTDHLSDRELYAFLVEEAFHEITKDMPVRPGWNQHLDVLGSGSEEDTELHLRYYADDEYRRRWAEEWGDPLPPKEPRPYDRDRLLPKAKDE